MMEIILRPSTAITSMVYVLFSSLSNAWTVFSSPEYFPIEKYFLVSPWREYLHRKSYCSYEKSNNNNRDAGIFQTEIVTLLGENLGHNLGWWQWRVLVPPLLWRSPHNGSETGSGPHSHHQCKWRLLLWKQVRIDHELKPQDSVHWAPGYTHSHAQSPTPGKTCMSLFSHRQHLVVLFFS